MPNKPTTLRESWKEEFREYFDKNLKPKKPTMKNLDREIIVDFISKLLTSHNTELVQKIEGMKKHESHFGIGGLHTAEVQMGVNQALDQVISLINQDK